MSLPLYILSVPHSWQLILLKSLHDQFFRWNIFYLCTLSSSRRHASFHFDLRPRIFRQAASRKVKGKVEGLPYSCFVIVPFRRNDDDRRSRTFRMSAELTVPPQFSHIFRETMHNSLVLSFKGKCSWGLYSINVFCTGFFSFFSGSFTFFGDEGAKVSFSVSFCVSFFLLSL